MNLDKINKKEGNAEDKKISFINKLRLGTTALLVLLSNPSCQPSTTKADDDNRVDISDTEINDGDLDEDVVDVEVDKTPDEDLSDDEIDDVTDGDIVDDESDDDLSDDNESDDDLVDDEVDDEVDDDLSDDDLVDDEVDDDLSDDDLVDEEVDEDVISDDDVLVDDDIDELPDEDIVNPCESVDCGENGTCDVETGTCDCESGFEGESCANDIDECVMETDDCTTGQNCLNTTGSFACEEIDGCTIENNPCNEHAICTDNPAPLVDASCECTTGYTGDGLECEPVLAPVITNASIDFSPDPHCVSRETSPVTFNVTNINNTLNSYCEVAIQVDTDDTFSHNYPYDPEWDGTTDAIYNEILDKYIVEISGQSGGFNYTAPGTASVYVRITIICTNIGSAGEKSDVEVMETFYVH